MTRVNLQIDLDKEQFKKELGVKDGKDYILTEKDKIDIASQIEVPVVEKVIEKTETIKEVALKDTGEQIIDKINSSEGKIQRERVEGLEDEIKSLKIEIANLSNRPPGGLTGRDLIDDIDLSSQLDGVTKTFNFHAIWKIISVHLSSYPHALRKGTDFTSTQTSITFTSQIEAATSLATGQTCVLTVVNA